jgi:hypothetical protein
MIHRWTPVESRDINVFSHEKCHPVYTCLPWIAHELQLKSLSIDVTMTGMSIFDERARFFHMLSIYGWIYLEFEMILFWSYSLAKRQCKYGQHMADMYYMFSRLNRVKTLYRIESSRAHLTNNWVTHTMAMTSQSMSNHMTNMFVLYRHVRMNAHIINSCANLLKTCRENLVELIRFCSVQVTMHLTTFSFVACEFVCSSALIGCRHTPL